MIAAPADPDNVANYTTSFPLDINYDREIYTYDYKTIGDIISYIGGIKGALSPLFNILNPILALIFLLSLAGIL